MERNAIFAGLHRYVIRFRGGGGGKGIAIRAWINRVNRTFSLKRVRRFAYCDRTCFSNGAIIYEWRKKKGGRIYDVFAATVETVRFKELCPRSVNSMKINRS